MTKFHCGDDVIVNFSGIEHQGEVLEHRGGYVMVKIVLSDPAVDYTEADWLDPEPTVCVEETKVRHTT